MRILSIKPGHDGTVACVEDGELLFSFEGEKNSYPRLYWLTPENLFDAFSTVHGIPDVLAESGWQKGFNRGDDSSGAGYLGIDKSSILSSETTFFGHPVHYFSSSHERSHIFCAFGMSPFPQGEPCYVLVWEGVIGSFYLVDDEVRITHLGSVLLEPGSKYSFAYYLADERDDSQFDGNCAGKLMALASFSNRGSLSQEEAELINSLLGMKHWMSEKKSNYASSPFHRCGVESVMFKNFAGKFSNAIFDLFYTFAERNLKNGYPLLISGGCGLNCEWNTKWKQCGLFAEVFVPPCANDAGSAIGTAIDAQFHYTRNAKIKWSVYTGAAFVNDIAVNGDFNTFPLDMSHIVNLLSMGKIIAWVQGRYEIGPRALGNRSLLAAPFKAEIKDNLNRVKQRADYRPIAPVCLEEDVSEHFDWLGESPFMLYFQRVTNPNLQAITHIDGTARLQTVNHKSNPALNQLLRKYRERTGCGVLCNTSLNFPGRGFINRLSDLLRFQRQTHIDALVINDRLLLPKGASPCGY